MEYVRSDATLTARNAKAGNYRGRSCYVYN
jgi:hypothetical protein